MNKIWTASLVFLAALAVVLSGVISYNVADNKATAVFEQYKQQTDGQLNNLQASVSALETTLVTEKQQNIALTEKLSTAEQKITELETKATESTEVISDLEQQLADVETVEVPSEEIFSGYILDEKLLGEQISEIVNDNDWNRLFDGQIRFDGDNYDTHEEIVLTSDLYLVTNSIGYDEDFGNKPYLITNDKNSIVYKYVFDDSVDVTKVTEDEPLEITFAGQAYRITGITSAEVEFEKGNSVFFREGDSTMIDGKTITVEMVSDSKVYVVVNGVGETIEEFDSKVVNGVEIKVSELLSNDRGGIVTLIIGDNVADTQDNNDDFMDNDDFKFSMDITGNDLKELQISYEPKFKKIGDSPSPLTVGDKIVFVDNFFTFGFDSLQYNTYKDFEISLDEITADGELISDSNAVIFEGDKGSIEVGTEETDYLFVVIGSAEKSKSFELAPSIADEDVYEIYFIDSDNEVVKSSETSFSLVNDDTSLIVTVDVDGVHIFDGTKYSIVKTDIANLKIGTLAETAENTDIEYDTMPIGNIDNDALIPYGYVFRSVESNLENDEIVLSVPTDKVEATFKLY